MTSSSPRKYDFLIIDDLLDWHEAVGVLASHISVDRKAQMIKDERYWGFLPWLETLSEEVYRMDKEYIRNMILLRSGEL